MNHARPRVIAIAAPMGGGKSALTQALATALNEQGTLAFDDYETASTQSVDALANWLAQGANFDMLEAPGLIKDLHHLRDGGRISRRNSTQSWQPNKYVLFEMPLGRSWSPAAGLIDHLIWIDVPLDLALARRVREIVAGMLREDTAGISQGVAWLRDYLMHYERVIHRVLTVQRERVQPCADLVLDGTRSVEMLVKQVEVWLAQEEVA